MIFVRNQIIMRKYIRLIHFLLILTLLGCTNDSASNSKSENLKEGSTKEGFNPQNKTDKSYKVDYFSGEAEISTYELSRARYDNNHPGEAVLIFVTEPFLFKDQVKSDEGSTDQTGQVLKMNRIDRFTTGIYDYSMYTSVFTPSEGFEIQHPLKITFSSQDWCGQVFAQLNNSNGLKYSQYSYFQSEGDTVFDVPYTITEDNIFNIARIDVDELPIGDFEILPSQSYLRTAHIDFKPYEARSSMEKSDSMIVYNYEIPALQRSVRIFLEPNNHNRISQWTETYPTIFDGVLRTSKYQLKSTRKTPYWKKNKLKDTHLRDSLKLD